MRPTARAPGVAVIWLMAVSLAGCSFLSDDLRKESHNDQRAGRKALAERRYSIAQANLERALQNWPFKSSLSTGKAAVYNNLGWACEAQGNHAEALGHFIDGRTQFRTDTRCSHPFLAILLNHLCECHINRRTLADAQAVCLEAFAVNAKRLPEKTLPVVPPEDIAWGLFNHGVAWAKANAAPSYFDALAGILEPGRLKADPAEGLLDSEKIPDVYHQLGRLALQLENYDDSERFHDRALSLRKERYGALHAGTAESMAALGQVRLCQGRIDQAENLARDALWILESLPDARPTEIVKAHLGLGLVVEAKGELHEALGHYRLALQFSISGLTVSASETLRQALRRYAGDPKPGHPEQTYVAMKKSRQQSETQSRLAALGLHGIGRVLACKEPRLRTERYDLTALSIRAALLGSRHPLVARSHLAAGRAFELLGRFEDARAHYWRGLTIAELALGKEHPIVGLAYYYLGRTLQLQGQVEDAERFFRHAAAIIRTGPSSETGLDEEAVSHLQKRIERDACIDELQGPEARATLARPSPHLPRDHQTPSELLEKKWNELHALLQPGQEPEMLLRGFINLIDDPIDDFKHQIQGMKVFGYRVYWPEGFMRGAGDPCR